MINRAIAATKTNKKLTTPQLLKVGLYASWSVSAVVLGISIVSVQAQRYAIKTVGKDAAPSILTAQRVKDSLAGMDAEAVNDLLIKPGATQTNPGYEERRQKFAERMVAAAENITYGDAERKPIQTLQLVSQDYIAKLQQARDFHADGKEPEAIAAYRSAAEILDKILLPAADELDRVNSEQLDKAYDQQFSAIAGFLFLIVVSGLLLLAALAGLQWFLNARMKRVLNPALLGATVLAIGFLGYTIHALSAASSNLSVAKLDAFTSLHALRKVRSLMYGANADESRFLFDTTLAKQHERAFFNKAEQIAKIPPGETPQSIASDLATIGQTDRFQGFLGDESANITFPGEREATSQLLLKFGTYLDIDRQIRQLEQSGNRPAAIALCTGTNPGQSNWAFDEFKKAHDTVYNINLKAFDGSIEQGFQELEGFEFKSLIVILAIVLLILIGLQPRLKEYD